MQQANRKIEAKESSDVGYFNLAAFCARHFSRGVLKDLKLQDKVGEEAERVSVKENAERFAADLEQLGPSYIKGAQLLSSRADFLPPAYQSALSRLQDHTAPLPFEEIAEVVENDLGAPIKKLFISFEQECLASASLSQIHRAVLHSGRDVAVKVQRPGLRQRIQNDYSLVRPMVNMLAQRRKEEYGFLEDMLEDTYHMMLQEIDFSRELEHLQLMQESVRRYPNIVIPTPVPDYCRGRVLTMSLLRGRKITDIGPLGRQEVGGAALLDELYACYLHQILSAGLFHADPHPGNVLLTADGRLGLVDLGMVCRVAPGKRRELISLFLALAEADVDRVQESTRSLCRRQARSNQAQFDDQLAGLVMESHGRTVGQLNIGDTILQIGEIARGNGFIPPKELNFIGKVCVNLERVTAVLDENFDPSEATCRHVGAILQRDLLKSLRPEQFLQQSVELKEALCKLPRRLNALMDSAGRGMPRIEIDAVDEHFLMSGIQKVANRITLGLIAAAMIVAGARLASVESQYRLFGYPAFAVLLFALAAIIGAVLLHSVLTHDVSRDRSKREDD